MIRTTVITVAVLAAPTPNPKGESNGMAISLTKHSSSLNPNKNVNPDALNSRVESHSAAIIRGMKCFEWSTGTPHPSALKRGDSGASIDLTNYKNDWYGTILIGTPAKSFTVQLDTGSSDLFVPASTGDQNCRSHTSLWDPASSLTAEDLSQIFGIEFGDGATATGKQYTDNVTIAGFTADVQTIGAATTYSSNMAVSEFAPDGILGLAFPSISEYHDQSPLFYTLFSEGKLPRSVFSLKLTASGGELYVGGMNEALYIDSTLSFTPVTDSGLWELEIDNIKVDDRIALTGVRAIVDTGCNYIVGDPPGVLALHQAYGGKAFADSCYYTFPCNSFPSMTFTMGGIPLSIPADVLNKGRVRSGSRDCFSGIVSHETGYDSWTIGTIFLQLFYTVFDFGSEPPRVGFAKLASMPIT